VVQFVEMDLDAAGATSGHATARKLLKAMEEFHTYIENNKGFIPNYGERYRRLRVHDQLLSIIQKERKKALRLGSPGWPDNSTKYWRPQDFFLNHFF
jgi:hypothetical protein